MLATLPVSVENALNVMQKRPQQVKVTESNEDENLVVRPDWQPILRPLYRSRCLLFSAAGLAELKLSMTPSKSEKKRTMYVQNNAEEEENGEVLAGLRRRCRHPQD